MWVFQLVRKFQIFPYFLYIEETGAFSKTLRQTVCKLVNLFLNLVLGQLPVLQSKFHIPADSHVRENRRLQYC